MDLSLNTSRRRLGLTPLIDVVLLMLIFFMLTSRIAIDAKLDLFAGQAADEVGQLTPKLVSLSGDELRLNGKLMALENVVLVLQDLVREGDDLVILTSDETTTLAQLVEVMSEFETSGFQNVALSETGAAK